MSNHTEVDEHIESIMKILQSFELGEWKDSRYTDECTEKLKYLFHSKIAEARQEERKKICEFIDNSSEEFMQNLSYESPKGVCRILRNQIASGRFNSSLTGEKEK